MRTSHIVVVLALLTLGFRVVQLSADPPADFSWSGGEFADEGYWSHNARNAVLFGRAVLDEWDARAVSPLFGEVQSISFHLFGVGLLQVRLVGLLSSLLIAITAFFLVRRHTDDGTAFFASALISLSYPMIVLGRQGLLDPFAAALAILAIYLADLDSKPAAFLSGVFFVAACTTKYLMIFAILPIALATSKRALLASGIAVAGLVWVLADYLPHRQLLASYGRYYSSQQSWQIAAVAKNVVLQPFYLYFAKTPAVLFLGNLMLWFFLFAPKKKIEKIFWVWLLAGILFFAFWRYRPIRYYTSLIPPLAALAAIAFVRLPELSQAVRSRALMWIGMALPALQLLMVLIDRWFQLGYVPAQAGINSWDGIIFIVLTISAVFLLSRPRWIASAFIIAFLCGDVRSYLAWMVHPQFQAAAISQDLQTRIGSGTVTGQWAPEVCLNNTLHVVPVWYGFVNSDRPFQKYDITHVLVWRYALGGEKYEQWYPEDFRNFTPVARYTIKDSELILYEKRSSRASRTPRPAS